MQIAGERERRSRAQTPEAEVTGKRCGPYDAERSGARPSRRRLEGHPDGRPYVGMNLMERGNAERDLSDPRRNATLDR